MSSGNRRRPVVVEPRRRRDRGRDVGRRPAAGGGLGRRRGRMLPGAPADRLVADALACGGDVLGPGPAAAADDLRALGAPLGRHVGVRRAVDGLVEAPAVGRVVAEVRVHAERQVGEVAQPRQHAGHVVGRQAVDEHRADADVLELARGAAELVALRAAPVLAEDAAHAVAAAAEADPHRDAGLHQRLDRAERQPVADERHRLEQHEVRRVLVEDARQELEHLLARLGVDVAVDAERERRVAGTAGLLDRLAADAQPAPRDVHPVHRRRERGLRAAVLAPSGPTCSSRRRRSRRRGRSGGRRAPRRARGRAPTCPTAPRPRAASRRGACGRARSRCRRRGSRTSARAAAPRRARRQCSSPAIRKPPSAP